MGSGLAVFLTPTTLMSRTHPSSTPAGYQGWLRSTQYARHTITANIFLEQWIDQCSDPLGRHGGDFPSRISSKPTSTLSITHDRCAAGRHRSFFAKSCGPEAPCGKGPQSVRRPVPWPKGIVRVPGCAEPHIFDLGLRLLAGGAIWRRRHRSGGN